MVYGKSPSTTAPVPPTGMSTELAVGCWLLAVGTFGGGASVAFLVDFPNGDAATGLATGFVTGGAVGTGFSLSSCCTGAAAGAAGVASLIWITSTLCSAGCRSAAN